MAGPAPHQGPSSWLKTWAVNFETGKDFLIAFNLPEQIKPTCPQMSFDNCCFLRPRQRSSIKPVWVPGRFARTDYTQHPLWDSKSHKRTRIFNICGDPQSAGKPIGVSLEKFGLTVLAADAGSDGEGRCEQLLSVLPWAWMARTQLPLLRAALPWLGTQTHQNQ